MNPHAREAPPKPSVFVVDASVAIKLFLQEAYSDRAQALFERLTERPRVVLCAPDLLIAECANILWKCVHRLRLDAEEANQHTGALAALEVRSWPTRDLATSALALALEFEISAYDACYVALAKSLNCPLVTADERLVRKVSAGQVEVLWLGDVTVSPRSS